VVSATLSEGFSSIRNFFLWNASNYVSLSKSIGNKKSNQFLTNTLKLSVIMPYYVYFLGLYHIWLEIATCNIVMDSDG